MRRFTAEERLILEQAKKIKARHRRLRLQENQSMSLQREIIRKLKKHRGDIASEHYLAGHPLDLLMIDAIYEAVDALTAGASYVEYYTGDYNPLIDAANDILDELRKYHQGLSVDEKVEAALKVAERLRNKEVTWVG